MLALHAAGGGRPAPPGVLDPVPRRRRRARAAGLEDLARVPRPSRRAPGRRADGRSALPGRLAGLSTPRPGTIGRRKDVLEACDSSPHSSQRSSSPPAAAVAESPADQPPHGWMAGVVWGGKPICPSPTGKDSLTCHPTPLANGAFVVSGGGATRRVHADAKGRFRVALPPGRYAIRPGWSRPAERSASWPAAWPTSASGFCARATGRGEC